MVNVQSILIILTVFVFSFSTYIILFDVFAEVLG